MGRRTIGPEPIFGYLENSLDPRETIGLSGQYIGLCSVTVCNAGLTLAERLVYVLGRGTIRNIRALD